MLFWVRAMKSQPVFSLQHRWGGKRGKALYVLHLTLNWKLRNWRSQLRRLRRRRPRCGPLARRVGKQRSVGKPSRTIKGCVCVCVLARGGATRMKAGARQAISRQRAVNKTPRASAAFCALAFCCKATGGSRRKRERDLLHCCFYPAAPALADEGATQDLLWRQERTMKKEKRKMRTSGGWFSSCSSKREKPKCTFRSVNSILSFIMRNGSWRNLFGIARF